MARTFSPLDLVTLPRTDARGAVALAAAVEGAAAKVANLPEGITSALADVHSDRVALEKELEAGPPAGTTTVKEADRVEDLAATGLHMILAGWSRFAEFIPEGKAAKDVLQRVYGDGLEFVNYKVEQEWAVIQSKLGVIKDEGLEESLAMVGAAPALAFLRKAHEAYGVAIGMTEPPPESPAIRRAFDHLLDSLRAYVVQVVGSVRRGKAETQARADDLLRPITEWRVDKPAAKAGGAGGATGTGTGGAGAGTP